LTLKFKRWLIPLGIYFCLLLVPLFIKAVQLEEAKAAEFYTTEQPTWYLHAWTPEQFRELCVEIREARGKDPYEFYRSWLKKRLSVMDAAIFCLITEER